MASIASQNPPAPMPNSKRPPLRRSRLAALRAITAGCLNGRLGTLPLTWMCFVREATYESSVQVSWNVKTCFGRSSKFNLASWTIWSKGRSGVAHRYVHLRNPAVRAWARMLRLSQKVVQPALAERLRALGLNLAEFDILDTLAAREGLTQQELADALLVTKGNMTYHLCRMAERGAYPGYLCSLEPFHQREGLLPLRRH
jgi:hypothetical protein